MRPVPGVEGPRQRRPLPWDYNSHLRKTLTKAYRVVIGKMAAQALRALEDFLTHRQVRHENSAIYVVAARRPE